MSCQSDRLDVCRQSSENRQRAHTAQGSPIIGFICECQAVEEGREKGSKAGLRLLPLQHRPRASGPPGGGIRHCFDWVRSPTPVERFLRWALPKQEDLRRQAISSLPESSAKLPARTLDKVN